MITSGRDRAASSVAKPRLVGGADSLPVLGEKDVRSRAGEADLWTATQFVAKRLIDFVGALLILLVLSPLFLGIALAVWITSPGPVIYKSARIGLGGRRFGCLKFRSMRKDADVMQAGLEAQNEAEGVVFKMSRDPRVTRVGRWLRSSGLDELPQLLNIMRGNMSLVGPRPLPIRDCALLGHDSWRRHSVLPGISGPWQLDPERHVDATLLARHDLEYVDDWSLWSDAKVMGGTVWFGIRRLLSTDSELAAGD